MAGLACAGLLAAAGAEVLVLDKGRRGRSRGDAADRRPAGRSRPALLSWDERRFLEALDRVPATQIRAGPAASSAAAPATPRPSIPAGGRGGWPSPRQLRLPGSPWRAAWTSGSGVRAARLILRPGWIGVQDEAAQVWEGEGPRARPPRWSSQRRCSTITPGWRRRALLRSAGTSPCQGRSSPSTTARMIPRGRALSARGLDHPQADPPDSSKRARPRRRALVLQARPAWSAAHLEDPADAISAALLGEAARLLGPWAASPAAVVHHRWRYAQVQSGAGFARPYLTAIDGARLGLTGEAFHPFCGAEGAFLAGQRLARDLLGSDHA
ncbi:MAG: hypothetical protein IPK67_19375 [Planctomycetes bacterium]|nr:hypothetical protein [Planctomycetota bacterium]